MEENEALVCVFHANSGVLEIHYDLGNARHELQVRPSDLQMWEVVEAVLRRLRYRASE